MASPATPREIVPTLTRDPIPGSRKIYVEGALPGVRVPMREVRLAPTRRAGGLEENPPVVLYDTSGPYTDPAVAIDLDRGLAPLRDAWIRARADVVEIAAPSSAFTRDREQDPRTAALRFERTRPALRAEPGRRVTQMHYARRGIVTPEMEFVAIRENLHREAMRASLPAAVTRQHAGQPYGAAIPREITSTNSTPVPQHSSTPALHPCLPASPSAFRWRSLRSL